MSIPAETRKERRFFLTSFRHPLRQMIPGGEKKTRKSRGRGGEKKHENQRNEVKKIKNTKIKGTRLKKKNENQRDEVDKKNQKKGR